jgi:tetratricopeptide (TPR) repeat protein
MNPEENMFAAALEAMDCHDRTRARDLLTRLLKINPKNPDYWLYMSAVVDTRKETIYCLNEVLRLDAGNIAAKRGLILNGELPVDEKMVIPLAAQRRSRENELPKPSLKDQLMAAPPLYQAAGIVGLLVLMGAIGFIFTWFSGGLRGKQSLSPFGTAPAVDISTQVTAFSVHIATPTLAGPTPLAARLQTTFTPTPFYALTPHPRYESFLAGMRAYNNKEWDSAIQDFQQVATLEPSSGDVYFLIGEAYRQKGDFSNALASYRQALALSPQLAPAYMGRGMATLGVAPDNYKDAKADLKTAIDLDPNLLEAYLNLASILIERQFDGATALTYLNTAVHLAPDSADVYTLRARAYLLLKKPEDAIKDASHAMDLDFTLLAPYRLLGEAFIAAGNKKEALAPLYTYTLFEVQDAEAFAWLGMAYLDNDQPDKAMEAFNKALSADPQQYDALLARGKLYLANGDADAAVQDLVTALQINSRTFEGNISLGQAYYQADKFGDAYMRFSTAEGFIETPDQQAEMLYWRSQSLQALGETSAASRDWQELLNLEPQYGKPEWRTYARTQLQNLATETPTSSIVNAVGLTQIPPTFTKTATKTATPTKTTTPSKTVTLTPPSTSDIASTATPTKVVTPQPSIPPILTKTPTAGF